MKVEVKQGATLQTTEVMDFVLIECYKCCTPFGKEKVDVKELIEFYKG